MKNTNCPGKAKCLMIQGTTSSAGKSALTTGLLRYFSIEGYEVSPFKSQNMSLNSFVTDDGFEIAVSQAVQSEAAFKNPIRQMNPILIKPSSDRNMHLIVDGKFHGNMDFNAYNGARDYFLEKARESFEFLSQYNDLVILEGAGSPAEINLFKFDIANMGFAELYDIPVILVADIERGGVFASLFGTVKLLPLKWRRLVKGFIINKFRGDLKILNPGIISIESMLKIPCLGVLPYIKNLCLEAEDSLNVPNRLPSAITDDSNKSRKLRIGIVRLEHMSNFNEFDPLFADDGMTVRFFRSVPAGQSFDMIIIPGSKSTVGDILILKETGMFDYIKDFAGDGVIMGVCGGFQIMGKCIRDPFRIESETYETDGLGFFDTVTTIQKEKRLLNQKYRFNAGSDKRTIILKGYEIHNGRTVFTEGSSDENVLTNIFEPIETAHDYTSAEKGIVSGDKKKIGVYIHGLFGNGPFKHFIADIVAENLKSGKDTGGDYAYKDSRNYDDVKNSNYDLLSDNIRKYINMNSVRNIIGI